MLRSNGENQHKRHRRQRSIEAAYGEKISVARWRGGVKAKSMKISWRGENGGSMAAAA